MGLFSSSGSGDGNSRNQQATRMQEDIRENIEATLKEVEELESIQDDFWSHVDSMQELSGDKRELLEILDDLETVEEDLEQRETTINSKKRNLNDFRERGPNTQALTTWTQSNEPLIENILGKFEKFREALEEEIAEQKRLIKAEEEGKSDAAEKIAIEIRKHVKGEDSLAHELEVAVRDWHDRYT